MKLIEELFLGLVVLGFLTLGDNLFSVKKVALKASMAQQSKMGHRVWNDKIFAKR